MSTAGNDEKKIIEVIGGETDSKESEKVPLVVKEEQKEKEILNKNLIGVWIAILSVVVDTLGVSIVVPILPYYARSFGANGVELGYLYTAFSTTALVSTYLNSKLSDIVGRRICILISLIGSMTGFIAMALVENYTQLLLARIYCGCTSGSMTIVQAYVTDAIPKHQLSGYFSKMQGAIVLTFMVGPLVGGAMVSVSGGNLSAPYYFASGVASIGFLFAYFYLHDIVSDETEDKKEKEEDVDLDALDPEQIEQVETFFDVHTDTSIHCNVYIIGIISHFFSLTGVCVTGMTVFYVSEKYGMDSLEVSFMLLADSFCMVIILFFVFGKVAATLGMHQTAAFGAVIACTGTIIAGCFDSSNVGKYGTIAAQTFYFVGMALHNPVIPTITNEYANKTNRATVLSITNVIKESSGMYGPIMYGVLYDKKPESIFWVAGAIGLLEVIPMLLLGRASTTNTEARKAKEEDYVNKYAHLAKSTWETMTWWDENYEKEPEKHAGSKKHAINDELYKTLGKRFVDLCANKNYPIAYDMIWNNVFRRVDDAMFYFPEEILSHPVIINMYLKNLDELSHDFKEKRWSLEDEVAENVKNRFGIEQFETHQIEITRNIQI